MYTVLYVSATSVSQDDQLLDIFKRVFQFFVFRVPSTKHNWAKHGMLKSPSSIIPLQQKSLTKANTMQYCQ